MKRIVSWALAHRNQRRPRVIWLAALPLALSLLLAFTSLASPAFAATHTPTTSNLAATHLSAQTLLRDKISTIPNSAAGCVGNLPTNHVQTCFGIIGSGKYVQVMWVSAYVRHSPVTLALQMKGPNGFADYSAFVFVNAGTKVILEAQLNRNMAVGQYCGQSIVISGGGSGTACESVRA
jgi:hypothetical protein